MKRWIASLFTLALLPVITACSAAAAERTPAGTALSYYSEKKAEGRVKAGMDTSENQDDDGLYSGWIEVRDPATGNLLWYMRITGTVVVYTYPDSDYWTGSEYRFNEADGWYYTGSGNCFDHKAFALKTDGTHDYLYLPDGSFRYLYRISEKQPWLRVFEEMIKAYESRPVIEGTGSWKKTSEKEMDNDGSVLSWVETEYDENGNKIRDIYHKMEDVTRGSYSAYEYDEYGRIVLETYWVYSPDIDCYEFGYSVYYIYDLDGKLIRLEREERGCDRYEWISYYYDEYGSEIYSERYQADGTLIEQIITDYIYDKDGNIITRSVNYYYLSEYSGKKVYEYDRNGNLISIESRDADGNVTEFHQYDYDLNGRVIFELEEITVSSSTNYTTYKTYEYDDVNEMILVTVQHENGQLETAEIILDVNGNPLYETWIVYPDSQNSYMNTVNHVYDEYGNEIETICYDGNWNLYTYTEYEYTCTAEGQSAVDFREWGEAYLTGTAA